jgi:hypothetical protein
VSGLTFDDCVAVQSAGSALWWDNADRSDDITVDRLAAVGVYASRTLTGKTSQESAVSLPGGDRVVMRNSVAAGARGSSIAHGFNWPSSGDNAGQAIWEFQAGNVAHNNQGSGVRLWFNSFDDHVIANVLTYRHGLAGIENGAYVNAIGYADCLLLEDRLVQHASGRATKDGRPARFERITVEVPDGPALAIGRLRAAPSARTEFVDCTFRPGPGAPAVRLGNPETAQPFIALFRRCGITPDDIEFVTPFPAAIAKTSVLIEHEDGRAWEITLDMATNTKIVREVPPDAGQGGDTEGDNAH